MTDFPDLKMKAMVQFPAQAVGGTGLAVVKTNGTYTFNLAVDELALVTSVVPASAPTTFLLLWDAAANSYRRISLTNLKTTLAALP